MIISDIVVFIRMQVKLRSMKGQLINYRSVNVWRGRYCNCANFRDLRARIPAVRSSRSSANFMTRQGNTVEFSQRIPTSWPWLLYFHVLLITFVTSDYFTGTRLRFVLARSRCFYSSRALLIATKEEIYTCYRWNIRFKIRLIFNLLIFSRLN